MKILAAAFIACVLIALQPARGHWRANTVHNRVHAINHAFCGQVNGCWLGNEALNVSDCESPGYWPFSTNGQYWGAFQVSAHWRSTVPGWAWNIWAQSRHAYRVYRLVGWSHWTCKPR